MKLSKMAVSFLGISLFFCGTLLSGQDFSFRSEWFSSGDMSLMGQPYSDLYTCLTTGGKETAYSEYEIEFPETGDYELWGFYTAQNSRPMGLLFDGNLLTDKAFATVFDSWQTSNSKWEKQADLTGVTAGKHVIRLQAYKRDIPHISGFKLVPKFEMKTDWVLPRAIAKEKILADSEWQPSPWSGGWYEYIARDRFHKKESGETFSDHFARETAIA
ncbi:MAG: hypothetical protein IKW74_02920, partial [Thermoguttaceae bacterium]|nr:hypothetical protein [Thermoguttaceae bacterium]